MAQKETLTTRVTRLEDLAKVLLDAQIKTEEHFQRTEVRFQQMGERIEKLVISIGDLISRMPPASSRQRGPANPSGDGYV